MVVVLLDDVAADLVGDLFQLIGDVLHRAVGRRVAGDIRDDDVAVVDGVLDWYHVALLANRGDVYLRPRVRRRSVEVVDVEFDVVVGAPVTTQQPAHQSHTGETRRRGAKLLRQTPGDPDHKRFLASVEPPAVTFSICVRDPYETDDGSEETRFGVAVTTRLAAVGTLCPFANEHGAVATQSLVNVELGERGVEYLADGLAVDDALQSLLNADEGAPNRQLHGVDDEGTFAFSGGDCKEWYGHIERENFTVAGNLLTGESVVEATADAYEASDADLPLAERLVDALAAGHAEGGDKREELEVQSAALIVTTTEDREMEPYYNDLRVDASKTPVEDLRETYELADESYQAAVEKYEESYEEDDIDAGEE